MTADRARAYTRFVRAVRDADEPLTAAERERMLLAADAFLFARSWDDLELRLALVDMRALADTLLERWPAEPLEELLDDLERSGPYEEALPVSAPEPALAAA